MVTKTGLSDLSRRRMHDGDILSQVNGVPLMPRALNTWSLGVFTDPSHFTGTAARGFRRLHRSENRIQLGDN